MFRHADVVFCVHLVAVLNAAFCMTCSLLMLAEDARGDHTEEAYSRVCVMTAFCFPHAVAAVFNYLSRFACMWY